MMIRIIPVLSSLCPLIYYVDVIPHNSSDSNRSFNIFHQYIAHYKQYNSISFNAFWHHPASFHSSHYHFIFSARYCTIFQPYHSTLFNISNTVPPHLISFKSISDHFTFFTYIKSAELVPYYSIAISLTSYQSKTFYSFRDHSKIPSFCICFFQHVSIQTPFLQNLHCVVTVIIFTKVTFIQSKNHEY